MEPDWVRHSKVILLDTNFVMVPAQLKIDVFEELRKTFPNKELATIRPVVNELKKIPNGRIGLALIKAQGIRIIEATGYADNALLKKAEELHGIVATNDTKLKIECLKKNIPVIIIKGMKRVELVVE